MERLFHYILFTVFSLLSLVTRTAFYFACKSKAYWLLISREFQLALKEKICILFSYYHLNTLNH